MKAIHTRVPDDHAEELEEEARELEYATVSELIRAIIRDHINRRKDESTTNR